MKTASESTTVGTNVRHDVLCVADDGKKCAVSIKCSSVPEGGEPVAITMTPEEGFDGKITFEMLESGIRRAAEDALNRVLGKVKAKYEESVRAIERDRAIEAAKRAALEALAAAEAKAIAEAEAEVT